MEVLSATEAKYLCPRCGSTDIRCASTSSVLAIVMGQFALHPYRCRSCRRRFFRFAGKEEDLTYMEEALREAPQQEAQHEVSETQAAEQFSRLLKTEHWLRSYITDLLGAHAIGNGIDFHTAELLLNQEKESFESDLVLARRMYKLYPQLFRQEGETVKTGL